MSHPESYCHRCNGLNVIWSAPSPLWNEVMRGGDINGEELYDGIVCPTCFVALAGEKSIAADFRLYANVVRVPLQDITPSGRIWDDTAWKWVGK